MCVPSKLIEKTALREASLKKKYTAMKIASEQNEILVIQAIHAINLAIASASVVDDVDPSAYSDVIDSAIKVIPLAKSAEKSSMLFAEVTKNLRIAESNSILNPCRHLKGEERMKIEHIAQRMVRKADMMYDAEVLQITTTFEDRLATYKEIIVNYKKRYIIALQE